jgi:hypothetical protein
VHAADAGDGHDTVAEEGLIGRKVCHRYPDEVVGLAEQAA